MPNASKTDGIRTISPGGYDVYSCSVTLNNGNTTRIDRLVQTIEIIESLQTSSIQVILRLFDGINFLEKAHLSGGEKVELKIRRTENVEETFAKSKNKFDIEVYIAAIVGHTRPKPGMQAYNLECVSKHAIISNTKKLNRSFNGNVAQLVKNVFTSDLELKDGESFNIENISDSTDIVKGIYPSLSPLEALTWLTRNAANDGTPYFLYDTIQEGLQFKSYNDLIVEATYRYYNDSTFNNEKSNTPAAYKESQNKILGINSDLNRSFYDSITNGSYSSKLHTIDIGTKNYKQTQFNYNNGAINIYDPFSTKIKFDDTSVTDYTTNKQYYVSLNSKAYEKSTNYHQPALNSLQSRQSYFYNLGFMGLDIEIYGDFNLQVGNKVGVIIPKDGDITTTDGKLAIVDKYIGGSYLVSSVSHYFSPDEYRCSVGLQKDSLSFDLDSKIELGKESKQSNTGKRQTRRGRR